MKNLIKSLSVVLAVGAFGQAIWAYNDASANSPTGAEECKRVHRQLQEYLKSEVFNKQLEVVSTDTAAKEELEKVLQNIHAIMASERRGEPGP